jgi:large subunit ribosomal protein L4e
MADVVSLTGEKEAEVPLPQVFSEKLNLYVLKRAFIAEESERFQLKYTDPLAGKRKAAELTKRRRAYKTTYGHGLNRTPRKVLYHTGGSSFYYVGAVAPHTVGGREAHPPKKEKVMIKKINKKERLLAIRVGIAASANRELVDKFHRISKLKSLPLIVSGDIEKIKKTKEAAEKLRAIGLGDELERISARSIRAGKGKLRGRRYRRKLGPVLVVGKGTSVTRAFGNLNMSVRNVDNLKLSDVTNGGFAGRLLIWTRGAINEVDKVYGKHD